jgi:UDP-N-acetylmuramate dehydrogenase
MIDMQILENVSLKDYSSMKLGGNARYLINIDSSDSLVEALTWAKDKKLDHLIVGGGNNIVWKDEGFDGVVLVNKILGISSNQLDDTRLQITVGAGENWDSTVEKFTTLGYSGIENLSYIPGTCGAAPIQNIGAYGGEISKVLDGVEVYDTSQNEFVSIPADDCELGYRASIFKYKDKNRYVIVAITLTLEKKNPLKPYYDAVEKYITANNISDAITPLVLRKVVIAIRQSKLPDPKVNPNNGSFFANPIIDQIGFDKLLVQFPEIVYWPTGEGKIKISAGWLIDQIGYKDKFDSQTGMATWNTHSLTLVNKSAKSTSDLLNFKQQIISKIKDKFGIDLEQEPELLP